MITKLKVGKLFKPGVTRYQEGVKFDFTNEGGNLFLFYSSPTNIEIANITKGKVQYGYYKNGQVILMLFKFGSENWLDAPYSINLSTNLTELKEISEGSGYAVNIYLVDAATGILKGMRLISFTTKMSKMFREDLLKQKELPNEDFGAKLNAIYKANTTNKLVKLAKIIEKID